jgi:hypothetical protein
MSNNDWYKNFKKLTEAADDQEETGDVNFYVYAQDITQHMNEKFMKKENLKSVFELMLICDGEATHVASLTASSYYITLGYRVVPNYSVDTEEQREHIDSLEMDLKAEDHEGHGYTKFMDYHSIPKDRVSELVPFERQDTDKETWEEAEEYFSGNDHSPPITHYHSSVHEEVVDEQAPPVQDTEEFVPGDDVHLGFGVKGGAGFTGKLDKIENGQAHITNAQGKTYKGPADRLSRDQNAKPNGVGQAKGQPTPANMVKKLPANFVKLPEGDEQFEKPRLKLVKAFSGETNGKQLMAKVYKDMDWNEYRVKHYENGSHLTEADYHTNDKEEALEYAKNYANGKFETQTHQPEYRYDYDRLSGTGIIVRLSDNTTSLRYTGEDAERLRHMSDDELKDEAETQDFD